MIKEVLRECAYDFNLRVARDGQDALQYLRELDRDPASKCPALVLLDLNLPKVPGIEVLRELRRTSHCKYVPVIVVTSSTAEADRAAVQHLGTEAYFEKPANLAAYMKLAHVIDGVLRAREKGHKP